jgi:hypothetical protein
MTKKPSYWSLSSVKGYILYREKERREGGHRGEERIEGKNKR